MTHVCATHVCVTHVCVTHVCVTHVCVTHVCVTNVCVTHVCVTHVTYVCAQPVPQKITLETVVEMEIEILDGHHRSFFTRLI